MKYISNISDDEIMILDNAIDHGKLTLSLQVFFNPVDNERIKKIKAWIQSSYGDVNKSQTTFSQQDTSSGNFGQSPLSTVGNGPRFQKLFDKILEEYMSEDAIAAQWKSDVIVKKLSLGNLSIENN